MAQLPHTPSYDSRLARPQKTIKRKMEDGTIMGRVKSDPIWEFDVVYKQRPIQEFLDIQDFYDTYGEHTPFQFEHTLNGFIYDVIFESEPTVTIGSFDTVDFGFKLVEVVGGDITLPTISSLPTANLRLDYDVQLFGGLPGETLIYGLSNQAPNYSEEVTASGSERPTKIPLELNGYTVARFAGAQRLESDGQVELDDYTFYIVFKATGSSPNSYERPFDFGWPTGPAVMRLGTEADTFGASALQPDPPYAQYSNYNDGDWHVLYGGRQGSTGYLFKDGVTVSTLETNDDHVDSVFRLGNNFSGAWFKGDIARFVMYDTFLNTLKRHQIFNFLKTYYAI